MPHYADIASTELHDVMKCNDLEVERLQSELAQVKQKAVIDLEKERAEHKRQMHHDKAVYSAPARWAAAAQVPHAVAHHLSALSLRTSAGNVHRIPASYACSTPSTSKTRGPPGGDGGGDGPGGGDGDNGDTTPDDEPPPRNRPGRPGFPLMMKTNLEMDFRVSLASLSPSTSG